MIPDRYLPVLCVGLIAMAVPEAHAAPDDETGSRLGAPTPGARSARARMRREAASASRRNAVHEVADQDELRDDDIKLAPRVELSWGTLELVDGRGGGRVHAGGFGFYLPTGALRLGARGEIGSRDYRLGGDDVLFRAVAVLGYQHLPTGGRVAPHLGLVGVLGVVLGQRFDTSFHDRLRGAGVEGGLTLRAGRVLFLGLALGYTRASLGGLSHDLFELRLALGL